MKRRYKIHTAKGVTEREYSYIPVRYIVAAMLTLFEVLAVIATVVALCYFVPYFYVAAFLTEVFCVIRIAASDDNPEYKVPWLLVTLLLPIAGFMLYFLFYSRKLQKKFIRRLSELRRYDYRKDTADAHAALLSESPQIASQATMLTRIADTHLFRNTRITYFPLGKDMMEAMLHDLKAAEHFIFLEYFIIEEGVFWGAILDILKEKAKAGVTVRVLYDDIGCMSTLPGDYARTLGSFGIEAIPFSRLRGNADSEFNNRSHRKILVIDGRIGYTGGVNIADEYIGEVVRFGHWKDTAIRMQGDAVAELTRLFLCDFGMSAKVLPEDTLPLYPQSDVCDGGFVIPFGDGPRPLYERRVGKCVIQSMLHAATRYAYITTPYLIIDNDLCLSLEGAALRGVDVRILVPHIPDKRLVFQMTRSFYPRLMKAGVRIYEYTPGFLHAKSYLVDDELAMIGTINLDYRSLVHHFENGVWMYRCDAIGDLKQDMTDTLGRSQEITSDMLKTGIFIRFLRAVVRIFAPML